MKIKKMFNNLVKHVKKRPGSFLIVLILTTLIYQQQASRQFLFTTIIGGTLGVLFGQSLFGEGVLNIIKFAFFFIILIVMFKILTGVTKGDDPFR